jgi:DNA-binding cell septation regulator SpoVG
VTAAIEVLEVRRVDAGNLKAFATVELGCVILHGCRVIQQDGQRPWVPLPQTPARAKADDTGAGWFPVIEITNRTVMDQFRDAVHEAWGRGR